MTPIKPAVAVTALLVFAPAMIPSAAAQTYPQECAQRDVQVVTQMERYGEAQSVPGEILYEAFLALTRARQAAQRVGWREDSRSTTVSSRPPSPARCRHAEPSAALPGPIFAGNVWPLRPRQRESRCGGGPRRIGSEEFTPTVGG
jgi:hypothetical protein